MATKQRPDVVQAGLESGRFYLPEAPRISLYQEQYPNLSDLLVGDSIDLEITARVTDVDESGRYGLELVSIKMKNKGDLIEKATSEIVNIGDLTAESLDKLFTK